MTRLLVGLLTTLALAFPGAVPAAAAPADEKWHTRLFARVPLPGYPAYVHVHTNGRVYAGTYVNRDAEGVPSRVYEWSARGELLRSWAVPGQVRDGTHGVQVATQTRGGRLVLLETSTRSVLTLDVRTGRFRRVARFPEGSVPNYATWGPRGTLFVSDYHQPVIWKITPGQRRPKAWFTSPALDGADFGTTGLRYRPGRRDLVISQQAVLDGTQSPEQGSVYRLPVRRRGAPGTIQELWTSGPFELPDGFGIGRSGHLYIALVGSNQLVELTAGGREVDRFPETPATGENGSRVPFDNPCNATFLGTRVLVANQSAVAGDADHQAVLSVQVGERGRPAYLPRDAHF